MNLEPIITSLESIETLIHNIFRRMDSIDDTFLIEDRLYNIEERLHGLQSQNHSNHMNGNVSLLSLQNTLFNLFKIH